MTTKTMTGGADPLTKRATIGHSRPTVVTEAASNLMVFVDALGRLGYEPDSLLSAAALTRADLRDPDARIACETAGIVFEHAMRERPIKNLGTRLAEQTPMGAFPLIDYLALTSETVGEAIRQVARYFRLVAAPVTIRVLDQQEPIRVVYDGPPDALRYEFSVALGLLRLRSEASSQLRFESISLVRRPDDVADMERVLDCRVNAPASWNGWEMSRQAFDLPLRRRDSILHAVLQRQADERIRGVPDGAGTAVEVRRALASRVAGGDVRIESVARALAVSPRALQRALFAEGTSYKALVEAARKQAAEAYLRESSMSVGEVAFLLGYSEVAAFHRAFRRWVGLTPRRFRNAERRGS
jgi:AraC-like DNA-binding protein